MSMWDAFDLVCFGAILGLAFAQTVTDGARLVPVISAVFSTAGICMVLAKFGLLS